MRVDEHTITLGDSPVFYWTAAAEDPPAGVKPVYLHGIPTSADDWLPFLKRTGGVAPDLIGFGRSGKGGHLAYSAAGLTAFLGSLLDHLELDRAALVGHGWGIVPAVKLAAADPERVRRIVLISPPPLLPDMSWSRLERMLLMPLLGELIMGSITQGMLGRALRRGAVDPTAWPREQVREVWKQFDQGTQRAILRLQRSWDGGQRRQLASALSRLRMPALLVWGDSDPWSGPLVAEAYASRLPDPARQAVPGAGHWPWLHDGDVLDRVAGFLRGS